MWFINKPGINTKESTREHRREREAKGLGWGARRYKALTSIQYCPVFPDHLPKESK